MAPQQGMYTDLEQQECLCITVMQFCLPSRGLPLLGMHKQK
jgi:hypothetical protein